MARPPGTPNRRHEERRRELLQGVLQRLLQPDAATVSMRELAASAGVSVPTLKHYFGDRDQLIVEVIAFMTQLGSPFLAETARDVPEGLEHSLRTWARRFRMAWENFGVGTLFTTGLVLGARHPVVGPGFVDGLFEPLLQALEGRLAVHQERGELRPTDLRFAALELISPLVLAMLHQQQLGGRGCRPLDVDALLEHQLRSFVATHGDDRQTQADA
ncbi:MAG: TetR/AcrR family transcriptional regulator [Alphaproteobacteria bacterium]|nr:TetR/AcrR family transcriptional regulator [Alphaproteobacteria bacterium]